MECFPNSRVAVSEMEEEDIYFDSDEFRSLSAELKSRENIFFVVFGINSEKIRTKKESDHFKSNIVLV